MAAKFKQKVFFIPLATAANVAMGGGTVYGLFQSHNQAKQQEEAAERNEEQNREIKKSLDRLAKTAEKNPGVAAAAGSIMEQKTFANVRQIGGMLKDIGRVALEHRKAAYGLAAMGVGTGVGTYLIDKGIQRNAKKIGMPIKGGEQPQLNQQPPQQQKSYSLLSKNFGLVGQALSGAAFAPAFTLPGYLSERKKFLDQKKAMMAAGTSIPDLRGQGGQLKYANATLQHKTYSYLGQGVKSMGRGLGVAGRGALGFVGMVGKKNVKTWGQQILDKGIKNNNILTQRIGNYMLKNPNTSLSLMGAGGALATATIWDAAEKPTKAAIKAVDKNAFAYVDRNEKQNEAAGSKQVPPQ